MKINEMTGTGSGVSLDDYKEICSDKASLEILAMGLPI